jgi:hypothetical protein
MRRIPGRILLTGWLALAGGGGLWAQAGKVDPAAAERAKWEALHRAVQKGALTEAACTAKFTADLRAARAAAQGYLQAVAVGYLMWAKEREEQAGQAPAAPGLKGAEELMAAESAEVERRMKELDAVLALRGPVEEVRRNQEKLRFEWRSLPEAVAEMENRLSPLALRGEGLEALLRVQQGPLNAESQRLQTVYDLWETEISRRCAPAAVAEPKTAEDPFVTPAKPRTVRKKQ